LTAVRDWRIRDATLDEAAELEQLQRRASTVWEDYREQLVAHPEAIEVAPDAIRDGLVRVAVDANGARLGFSVALAIVGDACELDGLFVEPTAWHRGVGRALVEDVVERARALAAARLEVIANPRAVGFYERLGFVEGETATTQFGPAPRMRRTI